MSETVMLRTPTAKGVTGVDRENNALKGFVVAQVGSADGHGFDLDAKTLQQILDQGNAVDGGAKMRFTHPNMSNDGLGKFLGRARNFRMEGDLLRADGYLSPSSFKTPYGDLGNYVMTLAEEDPEAFGASVAVAGDREQRLNEDGTAQKGADGKNLNPVLRVKKLSAVDVVDQPAATTAMFTSETWAAQATRFADGLAQSLNLSPIQVAAKVQEFMPRYLESKGVVMAEPAKTEQTPTPAPDSKTEPEKVDLSAVKAEAEKSAREAERKRVSGIMDLCRNHKLDQLAAKLVDDGVELSEAKDQVLAALSKRDKPLSPDAPPEQPKKDDPDQSYREEYAAQKPAFLKAGVTEEDYVLSRRVDDGKDQLIPGSKNGKAA